MSIYFCKVEQLVSLLSSHAFWPGRICMGNDQLAGPCTDDVGVAFFVGALWQLGGGAWVVCVVVCCGCLAGGN